MVELGDNPGGAEQLGDNPMLMLVGDNPGDTEQLGDNPMLVLAGDNPRGSCLRSREVS